MATDRQTDRQTNRPTDKADYRDAGACSSQHLKIVAIFVAGLRLLMKLSPGE